MQPATPATPAPTAAPAMVVEKEEQPKPLPAVPAPAVASPAPSAAPAPVLEQQQEQTKPLPLGADVHPTHQAAAVHSEEAPDLARAQVRKVEGAERELRGEGEKGTVVPGVEDDRLWAMRRRFDQVRPWWGVSSAEQERGEADLRSHGTRYSKSFTSFPPPPTCPLGSLIFALPPCPTYPSTRTC